MSNDLGVSTHTSVAPGIGLTETAKKHIEQQLEKNQQSQGVRLSVDKTGCSGLSYVFSFVKEINDKDKHFEVEGIHIYVDIEAYPFLKGSIIDYVKEGLNYKFSFDNPNQTGVCGCGESFTVSDNFVNEN